MQSSASSTSLCHALQNQGDEVGIGQLNNVVQLIIIKIRSQYYK